MANYSYCKAILKISQASEGLRYSKHGVSVSPSSSFPPFFKGPGAGGAGHSPDLYNFSHIYALTNTNARHQHRGNRQLEVQ